MKKPRISVFPKCYFNELCSGEMDYFKWIKIAGALGAEGIEHYDGFFQSFEKDYIQKLKDAVKTADLVSSLLCFSPDFTYPDAENRLHQIERQKQAIDICALLGIKHCRTLSGQKRTEVNRVQGVRWVVECIKTCLDHAAERNVVLCMENHYKDGNWLYPEFVQDEDIFLEMIDRIDSQHYGVQYDPSNAVVGGYDPIHFLEKVKSRVVSMHASDRYLAPGATLQDLNEADGSTGYSQVLLHGVTGKGLNDYDRIFEILREIKFSGWISIEDGENGLEQLRESIEYLKMMRDRFLE